MAYGGVVHRNDAVLVSPPPMTTTTTTAVSPSLPRSLARSRGETGQEGEIENVNVSLMAKGGGERGAIMPNL